MRVGTIFKRSNDRYHRSYLVHNVQPSCALNQTYRLRLIHSCYCSDSIVVWRQPDTVVFKMTRLLNVDIDNIIIEYELSYQNSNDKFKDEINRLKNNILQGYTQKFEEYKNMLKRISDINNKINASREKLHCVAEKVECEKQTLKTENDRLESTINECRLLETEENDLKDIISETKMQLAQVSKEKKGSIKKLKKEINSFKTGVNMYEHFLQLSMNIEKGKNNSVFIITMKNLNNHIHFNITLEENGNDFKLIDILPRSQSVNTAASLYNQNKDIQGLLAFLYTIKE